MTLHATGEAHTARVALDIDVLADLEPVGPQLDADGEQAVSAADVELDEVRLGRDALGLVVAQQRARHVARRLGARADLHGVVPVLLERLVGDDLHLVELQHRARDALLAREDGRHALLGGEHARPQRRRLLAPLESRRRARRRSGEACGGLIEALVLVSWRRRRPADSDAPGWR